MKSFQKNTKERRKGRKSEAAGETLPYDWDITQSMRAPLGGGEGDDHDDCPD